MRRPPGLRYPSSKRRQAIMLLLPGGFMLLTAWLFFFSGAVRGCPVTDAVPRSRGTLYPYGEGGRFLHG